VKGAAYSGIQSVENGYWTPLTNSKCAVQTRVSTVKSRDQGIEYDARPPFFSQHSERLRNVELDYEI
jgi:hypothetical protein